MKNLKKEFKLSLVPTITSLLSILILQGFYYSKGVSTNGMDIYSLLLLFVALGCIVNSFEKLTNLATNKDEKHLPFLYVGISFLISVVIYTQTRNLDYVFYVCAFIATALILAEHFWTKEKKKNNLKQK